MNTLVHPARIMPSTATQSINASSKCIVYWMSRDMRVHDNWAMLYAIELAQMHTLPVCVVYDLYTEYEHGSKRFLQFKLKTLQEVEAECTTLGINFSVVTGKVTNKAAIDDLQLFLADIQPAAVVTDYLPLKEAKQRRSVIENTGDYPLYIVDAHNIIPVWYASPKQEYAAYTIRPKIHKLLPEFLIDYPNLAAVLNRTSITTIKIHSKWKKAWLSYSKQHFTDKADEVLVVQPGAKAANAQLKYFVEQLKNARGTKGYAEARNNPNAGAVSNLSPYLHYGIISAQRVAFAAQVAAGHTANADAFIEELIVRRELSDNYCHYNPDYDSFAGLPQWAQQTLNEHRGDMREYIYSYDEFEQAKTHDELWNAAQLEMVKSGKMHGYMRMYWAKKILEWTPDPETALDIGIRLNDTYELDGRDPNGYVGVAWSIGGVHDRAWPERPIYGKIRYMNYNGCKRKFDVNAYINKWLGATGDQASLL